MAEQRNAVPMVDLALFRSGTSSGGLAALVLGAFGLFGIYFFTSLWLQAVLGFSPAESGPAFLPMAAGLAALTALGPDASFLALMPGFASIGIGGGLVDQLTASVLGVLPHSRAGVAAGLLNTARQLGGLRGITLLGVAPAARQDAVLRSGAGRVSRRCALSAVSRPRTQH